VDYRAVGGRQWCGALFPVFHERGLREAIARGPNSMGAKDVLAVGVSCHEGCSPERLAVSRLVFEKELSRLSGAAA